ncbi:hypothetical protein [Falsirhodobacter halotolerans]|uniref:hypothetical protein n=1 Tax=Falsirhodobacter halotolerans TaxID=1146892 RepID=UPI001FD2F286|nr:hypothetical protein [Falsirhodobacter halotolerans]MCJ8141084.1 hypothetical protein [Falsirhodobacter halotolerans]
MREVARLLAGFVIWSVAFLGIYAVQATGCAMGVAPGTLRTILIAGIVVALAAGAVPLWWALRGQSSTLQFAAVICGIAALASTGLTFSAVFWAGVC